MKLTNNSSQLYVYIYVFMHDLMSQYIQGLVAHIKVSDPTVRSSGKSVFSSNSADPLIFVTFTDFQAC